ncbi:MAG: mannitol dehydrogenase family protein [Corynebacterium sp.]|nr:mannitol dehydrogenase family protein [Corynebacterium sp.]
MIRTAENNLPSRRAVEAAGYTQVDLSDGMVEYRKYESGKAMTTENTAKNIWLHVGVGNFHRAHQARYFEDLKNSDWALVGGNIRNDMEYVIEGLNTQGHYTLETVSPQGERTYERISSISRAIAWEPGLEALISTAADPQTKVIAFTVTEAGYYVDNAGALMLDDPAIAGDLKGECNTIFGFITKALERRAQLPGEQGKVTLVSCDNLRHNSQVFSTCLEQFLAAAGKAELSAWIAEHTTAPMTMVDRITPRTTEEVLARVEEATGEKDLIPVMSETFIQWVIEDNFKNGIRPPLETVGAEMVESVIPYEEAKIRILNAPHAAIAWSGSLKGKEYIHESVALPEVRALAYDYVTEDVIPSLADQGEIIDFAAYRDVVLERFANSYIKDTNQRVSADGFSKIPGQILPTLLQCYERGQEPRATAKVVAAFYRFIEASAKGELPFDYFDGAVSHEHIVGIFNTPDPLATFLGSTALFGELAGDEKFSALLGEMLKD